jgi:hypothetical protein
MMPRSSAKICWDKTNERYKARINGKTVYFPAPEGKEAGYDRCLSEYTTLLAALRRVPYKRTRQLLNQPGHIYFIRLVGQPYIKIGFTARHVDKRIDELERATPFTIECLAIISGNREREKYFHRKFHKYQAKAGSEWFICSPYLEAAIKNIVTKCYHGELITKTV